jgi:16S rRNA (adenine(1408)-N(1))-methyltransferase
VIVDLGTGDGRAVVARAAAESRSLFIGIDAAPAAMAEVSRRAARAAPKGGLPNALFVAASAETPPPELCGLASELTILFPWGSLLRGVLGEDEAVTAGIASLVAPLGRIEALVSLTDRDRAGTIDHDRIDRAWSAHGFELASLREATLAEVHATHSTWGRRLGVGRDRPACRLVLRRRVRSTLGDPDRMNVDPPERASRSGGVR